LISVRKSHAALWLGGIGVFIFFVLGSSSDLSLIPISLAAGGHFLANIIFSLRTRRKRSFHLDRAFSAAHQESSPEALAEVFGEEKIGGEFTLPVHLEAEAAGGSPQKSPLSGDTCIGWGVEVDLYKSTILGGDADYTLLEQVSTFDAFSLHSDPGTISVRPPGIVRGAGAREELLAWARVDEHPALRRIVDNAMQLQGLPRSRYTGIRVRESLFGKGAALTAWGTAAKTEHGLELRGSGTADDPGALVLCPTGSPAVSRRAVRTAIRLGINAALAAGLFAAAAGIAINGSWWRLEQAHPWLNVEKVGSLHWNGDGKSAEVTCRTLNLGGTSSWTLDPGDESVNLVSGDEKALVSARSRITMTRARIPAYKVTPGSFPYPIRGLGAFLFSVPAGPITLPEVSAHEGALVVDNRTPTDVEIRVQTSAPRPELVDTHWTIAAGERTRLVLHDRGFTLTEGDGILLRRAGESAKREQFIALGGDPAAAWAKTDRQWVLVADAQALAPHAASLQVRNPNQFDVRLKVFAPGSDVERATWTLTAGFGGDVGTALESGGAPFVFRAGDILYLEPLSMDTLYDGILGSCPGASWKDGGWTLRPM
jgi:hypothetical protein